MMLAKKKLWMGRKELGDEAEEIMPSLAQRWIEEGKEKGIEKDKIYVCKKALNSRISPDVVSKITGLPLKKVLEIKQKLQ